MTPLEYIGKKAKGNATLSENGEVTSKYYDPDTGLFLNMVTDILDRDRLLSRKIELQDALILYNKQAAECQKEIDNINTCLVDLDMFSIKTASQTVEKPIIDPLF